MKKTYISGLLCLLWGLTFAQDSPLWLRYPAISPDGKTIVFSYQGDLWRVAADGGKAVPLTLHNAHDYEPVWSHDGQSIAFASDRYGNFDVFVMPATGGVAKRLTYHSAPDHPSDFSPDNQSVLFTSIRLDDADSRLFPSGVLPELYSIPTTGGRVSQVLTTPAMAARYSRDGKAIIYQDRKGYEDPFRKHHTSSVTRDLWQYDLENDEYAPITSFQGEDRNPIISPDGNEVFYLSQKNGGALNVYKRALGGNSSPTQVTNYSKHPVRYLSMSNQGTLCYSYNGEIYTQTAGGQAQKVSIQIAADARYNPEKTVPINGGVGQMAVSPNGKEVAFIVRGEVFVTSVKEGTTKRITNTAEQERTVSFSPDGRALLYASERNESWNIYQTKLAREEEKYFFHATILKEEPVLETEAETFQPAWSPDGKEVAFLEERTSLKVVNLESKAVREIVSADLNYSYSDGDQHYAWSPDGKWFLVSYLPDKQWIRQAGLVRADGESEIINLTQSGYGDYVPTWAMGGKMMLWLSDRDGMKNDASWGGQADAYAMFFTQEAYDLFTMSEEDYELWKETEKDKKKEEEEEDDDDDDDDDEKKDKKKDKKKDDDDDDDDDDEIKEIVIELDGIEDRKRRLTIHSSMLGGMAVDKKGEYMYYMARFEKGYDLWKTNLRTRETKIMAKLGAGGVGSMTLDKENKHLFAVINGRINKFTLSSGKRESVGVSGEMILQENNERAYLYEHIWRQVRKKFYRKDLHGVDWNFYKEEYARFLPYINNNYDFAEMLSEMLGELNASHTGARYRARMKNGDATAALGIYFDREHTGKGLKIQEIMPKSPVVKKGSDIKAGVIVEKMNGEVIGSQTNHYRMLNRQAGKPMLLSLYDPATKKRWDETVKPISMGAEWQLRYRRWVANAREIVEKASNGRVGYVHVRGMNDPSYRTVYEEVLGKNASKEALIVDTRFNGGGWLHDDLATFLSGKQYMSFRPRGQELGAEPQFKWRKPSAVLMSEGNYSDAHMFPYTYRALGIGKLVGMPVPGTGTAVWWERLQNGMVFGIPQVGMITEDGKYMENTQLEPDVKVANDPKAVSNGQDQQLEAAVRVLLDELGG